MFKLISPREAPADTHWFSASQIQKWRDCPVCWAYSYLDGVKEETGEDAIFGSFVHKLLEKYLKTGEPIDPSITWGSKKRPAGKVALSGIKHLPLPMSCVGVEDSFLFKYKEIYFRGGIDFYYQKTNDTWIVGDHKTKSDLSRSLTEYSLPKNIQANLYAFYVANKHKLNNVMLNWVYYKSKGSPESKSVVASLDLTIATENVNLMVVDCEKMLKAFEEGKSAIDFDVPLNGCKAFGPCASRVVGTRLMRNPNMSEEKRSLKDFLDKRAVAVTGIEQPTPENDILEIEIPEPTEKLKELMQEIKIEPVIYDGINTSKGWTLLVDCLPQKGMEKVVELGDVLKPVFKMIAKDYNVGHHSFIPYEARGAFVTRLDKYLTDNPISDGTMVLMSMGSPDARDAFDVLINHATLVIRSAR